MSTEVPLDNVKAVGNTVPHTVEWDRKWEMFTVSIVPHEIVCMRHGSLDVFVLLQVDPEYQKTVGRC